MFPKETRILVIDDMMTMRKLVKKALTELGYTQLTEAANGSEAWEKIAAQETAGQPFQLIISDWNMPVMTGIELLRKCKQTPSSAKIPFVLLTAESEKSQVIEAVQLGVSGYMLKPFNAQQLAQKMAGVYANFMKKAA